MKLLQIYMKMILIRNYIKYINVASTIAISYLLISMMNVGYQAAVEILELSSGRTHQTVISLLVLIILGAMTWVAYGFVEIMKTTVQDSCILRGLGATMKHVRGLIFINMILLAIVSVVLGIFVGHLMTSMLFAGVNLMQQQKTRYGLYSNPILDGSIGFVLIVLIFASLHMEATIRRIPLSSIGAECVLKDKED